MARKVPQEDILNKCIILLFVLVPFWSAILFCLKDGKRISDIYIPLGGWSDEITYYKQIQGILSHGMPRGYFGYNQSKALYGTLGVWGLIPLIPYVVFGGLFGWNYRSPIYANLLFCVLGLWVICRLMRLSKKEMGALVAFWITNQFLNRYVLSGVVEASVIMQLMVITACGEYLLSEKIRETGDRVFSPGKDRFVLAFCTALICMLSLARPYFAVLFLIPFWKAVIDKKKGWMVALPILAIGTVILFFLNNHFFCSVYFTNIFSFEKLRAAGVVGFFGNIVDGAVEIARLIWYAIRYRDGVGWYYLLWAIEMTVMLFSCVKHIARHKRPPRMFIVTLTGNILILISIIELYSLGVGARHILSLVVVDAVLLVVESHFWVGPVLAGICVLSIVLTRGADPLPYQNAAYVEYMESLEEVFSELVTVTDEISYDNVVAMPTADIALGGVRVSAPTTGFYLLCRPA